MIRSNRHNYSIGAKAKVKRLLARMLDVACWLGMRIALVEAHYGRGKERLSGFGHDFIVIFRLWAPDRRRVGRWVAARRSELRAQAAFRLFLC